MQNAMTAESQTAYIGTSCWFTLCHNDDNGIAPSLENAYTILPIAFPWLELKQIYAR
ncbi:hypothetical protein Hanom_Chr17g01562051 [Helianthus anomalus]